MDSLDHHDEYFFNIHTHEVEHGRRSSWEHLLGPYKTAAEAAKAMETAKHRAKVWEDDDREWRGEHHEHH